MRSVLVIPHVTREAAAAQLDSWAPRTHEQWTVDDLMYVLIEDWSSELVADEEERAALEYAMGGPPSWAVQIDVSGPERLCPLVLALLSSGGVALDDYDQHLWTADEIANQTLVGGRHFFARPG